MHLIGYFKYLTTLLSYNSPTMELTHVECTIIFLVHLWSVQPSGFPDLKKKSHPYPLKVTPHCPPALWGFLNL